MHTSSTHTFLWHDYETFGLHTRRDRPAQFAGIRTDADLNEMGEPIELYCQPQLDYLPDPTACLLTGITPQRCLERGIPEPRFARQIDEALGAAGTIGVGYNTIRFDDEVTRHLFWRNLIDPYSREWRNQCGRWDLVDLVRATYALRPQGIHWPTVVNDQGEERVSFRLELLTAANGIAHDAAHDALSDVRATIALARLIKTLQPKLFDFYLALHKKDRVMQELHLPATQLYARPFIHVNGMFPAERGCMAVMWPLATHPSNKNEIIAWDLTADADAPSILAELRPEQIRERIFTKQADLPDLPNLPEGETGKVKRLPIKSVHLNKSPFVVGNLKTLTPALQEKWHIDLAQCLAKAELARALPDMSAVWSEVFQRPASQDDAPPDVDEALYDGFINDADRQTLAQLHKQAMTMPDKLGSRAPAFDDPRLDEVFWRFRARNFPQSLNAEDLTAWHEHCRARLVDGAGNARTLQGYFEEVDRLEANLDKASEVDTAGKPVFIRLREYGQDLQRALSSISC
ncbi:MAG: exodeoxyribonuclease I [Cytophagales bacterium]|nr:exodeoxyribonuclease I [Cytophagales bacterium]